MQRAILTHTGTEASYRHLLFDNSCLEQAGKICQRNLYRLFMQMRRNIYFSVSWKITQF